jgi:hypothetical protein
MPALNVVIRQNRFDLWFSILQKLSYLLSDDVVYRILGFSFVDRCEGCQRGTCRHSISLVVTNREFFDVELPGLEYFQHTRTVPIRRELCIPHSCPNCCRLWPVLETGPAVPRHATRRSDAELPAARFARLEPQPVYGAVHTTHPVRVGVPHAISVRTSEKVCDSGFVDAVGCNSVDIVSFLRRRVLADTGGVVLADEVAVVSGSGCPYDGNIAATILGEYCSAVSTSVGGSPSAHLIYGDRKRSRSIYEAANLSISASSQSTARITYGSHTERLDAHTAFTHEHDSVCVRCQHCQKWQIVSPVREMSMFRTKPTFASLKRPVGPHMLDPMSDAALDILYRLEQRRWKPYMQKAEQALGAPAGNFLKAPE